MLAETSINYKDEEFGLVVLSYLTGTLLKDIPFERKYEFITPIIHEIKKAHTFKSPGKAGFALVVAQEKGWSWKDFLMRNLTGEDDYYDWESVSQHKNVDSKILQQALARAKERLEAISEQIPLRLVHTDLNQSNIFVQGQEIEAIIDWSDSVYGDPIYDFARLRMNITHQMNQQALDKYYVALNLSDEEKAREEIYYSLHLIDYLQHYVNYGWDEIVKSQMALIANEL